MLDKKTIYGQFLGLFIGTIIGHVIGVMYSFMFIFILFKAGELSFMPNFLDLLNFLLLKDKFTFFPQIISIIFGTLSGYYFIEKRKIASTLALSLFCFFIIYIIFWYIMSVYVIGNIT